MPLFFLKQLLSNVQNRSDLIFLATWINQIASRVSGTSGNPESGAVAIRALSFAEGGENDPNIPKSNANNFDDDDDGLDNGGGAGDDEVGGGPATDIPDADNRDDIDSGDGVLRDVTGAVENVEHSQVSLFFFFKFYRFDADNFTFIILIDLMLNLDMKKCRHQKMMSLLVYVTPDIPIVPFVFWNAPGRSDETGR